MIRSYKIVACMAVVVAVALGLMGSMPKRGSDTDASDQLAAARAYLDAAATQDWRKFVSVASSHVIPREVYDKGDVPNYINAAYGLPRKSKHLKGITNFRLGPFITHEYLASAGPYLLAADSARIAESGKWPDHGRPPRAVFYDEGGVTYFVIAIHENGGWHIIGDPLLSRAEWLEKENYAAGLDEVVDKPGNFR